MRYGKITGKQPKESIAIVFLWREDTYGDPWIVLLPCVGRFARPAGVEMAVESIRDGIAGATRILAAGGRMLKGFDSQGSFFDTDYFCERLIPSESFYRKFREIVAPLVKDEGFESMYCPDNGRPPISPALVGF